MITMLLATFALLAPRLEVEDPSAHRTIAALTVAVVARDRREALDLSRLAWRESRWTPGAVSSEGACGLWQQVPRWRATTCYALQHRPVHAALVAVAVTRRMRALCGAAWGVCYQHGPYSAAGRAVRSAIALAGGASR